MSTKSEQASCSGLVIEYHREYCSVVLDHNQRLVVAKPRIWNVLEQQRVTQQRSRDGAEVCVQQIAVGDRVELSCSVGEQYVIDGIEPRRGWLMRSGTIRYGHQFQLVVANAERLAVVLAPNPAVKLAIADRYCVAALQGGLEPFLVVNKIDLDHGLPDAAEIRIYRRLGYQVLFTSALRGDGIAELTAALAGRRTAFCGESGVGKSTLLRLLTGAEITVGETKRRTGAGRQTTTVAHLYRLPGGGEVIDTPGIRVVGLGHSAAGKVDQHFADIAALAGGCRYRGCLHAAEADCQVRQAVECGELPARRLKSYLKLRDECAAAPEPWIQLYRDDCCRAR